MGLLRRQHRARRAGDMPAQRDAGGLQPLCRLGAQVGQDLVQRHRAGGRGVDDRAQLRQRLADQPVLSRRFGTVQRAEQLRADIVVHVARDAGPFLGHALFVGPAAFAGMGQHGDHLVDQGHVAGPEQPPPAGGVGEPQRRRATRRGHRQAQAALVQSGAGSGVAAGLLDVQGMEQVRQQRPPARGLAAAGRGQGDIHDLAEQALALRLHRREDAPPDRLAEGQVGQGHGHEGQAERRALLDGQRQDQHRVETTINTTATIVKRIRKAHFSRLNSRVRRTPTASPA